jgi:hypothetical protein
MKHGSFEGGRGVASADKLVAPAMGVKEKPERDTDLTHPAARL